MRGKILGADATGGTVSGEDGRRYKFTRDQWKSERTALAGDEVDFEGAEGIAREVFSVRSGAALDFSAVGGQAKALLGDSASSPVVGQVMALLRGSPAFQISLVILFASLFLTFAKLSSAVAPGASEALPDHGVYKVVNVNDLVDYLKTSLTAAAAGMDQLAQMMQGNVNPYDNSASQAANPLGNPKEAADQMRAMAGYANALYLLWLAPLGAVAVIVQSIRRCSLGATPLLTGVACLVSFGLLLFSRSAIIAAVKKTGNADAATLAGNAVVFGLGSYVILLCGLGLVAIATGVVRLPQRQLAAA